MSKNTFHSPSIESETIESLSEKLLDATTKLAAANQELLRIQKEREEMLSNISHDLRAPITAIRSAIDYLTSGQDISMEDYRSSIALIDRRTRNLEHLIQDMYYLFCVEDTSKELQFEPIEAAPFFETYFYDTIIDSRYDTHEMLLDIPKDLQCTIMIDTQKIVRVLDNLFTNAAKYSPEHSSITLQVSASPGELICSVIDTGYGIPKEALEHIFKRTYTVSSARTPGSATGSGLGLSIVKAIIERHGGEVGCESKEGEGSRFTFTLPVVKETCLL